MLSDLYLLAAATRIDEAADAGSEHQAMNCHFQSLFLAELSDGMS